MLKKINIIGCGYIGKKIAHLLKSMDVEPCCFVNSRNSKSDCDSQGLQTILMDLGDSDLGLNEETISGFQNSIMVYLVPPQRKGDTDTRMKNFVLKLKSLTVPPLKIVLISTTGVYGNCKGEWIDELHPANPQADRAFRRLSAETRLQKYCDDTQVECIVFRVPGIYATDKLPVKRITSGEPIVNAEDSGLTNRIHADDLSAFCVEALLKTVSSGIYNCCDGSPSTMNDYFTKVADALKLPRPEEISLSQAQQELSSGMLSYLAESKRISNKKLLDNFETRLKYPDLDAGLKNLIQIN
ncbi:MAG: NAD(P)-dependent oxidoreductase [endosymbiont of Galathealinum brachiosum]|uniref:NAD(P)-dependent oxidoreductase n=1 Tax=endosymbiont of Galathealinum brachiosum TaxID=2200906 RepID=A0A370DBS0_9GAMM|nr:MAG: NAD(P)-dependent oxidoreductase [endosymbiont of Galathealinum brachiosum]